MKKLFKVTGLLVAMILIGLLALFFIAKPELGASAKGDRLDRIRAQPNYQNGRFHNEEPLDESIRSVFKSITSSSSGATEPTERIPTIKPTSFSNPAGRLAVTWLGHSTVLIEIDGMRILTDPMWGERASPFSFMGPRRFVEVPLEIKDLPTIDAVLLSHDHYDHLDKESIRALKEQVPIFICPLGVGAHLEAWGVHPRKIIELAWWEETSLGELSLISTPARHFSGRSIGDRFATLWSSWVIVGPDNRVFFGGDGGMGKHFAEIGDKFGPFELSMLEVGAYSVGWPDVHLGPEQAVMAHEALRADHFLPIHWGTFRLAPHNWTEPIERLSSIKEPSINLLTPLIGERVEIIQAATQKQWWPEIPYLSAEDYPIWSSGYGRNQR
jgi:L-ascorbate metabolism protein UlaG (beta-lactamase superfamily)